MFDRVYRAVGWAQDRHGMHSNSVRIVVLTVLGCGNCSYRLRKLPVVELVLLGNFQTTVPIMTASADFQRHSPAHGPGAAFGGVPGACVKIQ